MTKPSSAPVIRRRDRPAAPRSGGESAEIVRTTIEARNVDLARWYSDGEVDALAALYTEDAWQLPPHLPPLVGREAIRGFWRDALACGRWEVTLRTRAVEVCGDMAVERGAYILRFTPAPDARPNLAARDDRGHYLVHWRREDDGEWRIVGGAPVSDVPDPSPERR